MWTILRSIPSNKDTRPTLFDVHQHDCRHDASSLGRSYAEQCQMDELIRHEEPAGEGDAAIKIGGEFLRALLAETDTVLFRPIESWTEAGKKRSRVIYESVIHRTR